LKNIFWKRRILNWLLITMLLQKLLSKINVALIFCLLDIITSCYFYLVNKNVW
jgi:hypothetical protein